jgi:hypothetical protein
MSLCKHIKAVLEGITSDTCDEPIKESLMNLGLVEYLGELMQAESDFEKAKKTLAIAKKSLARNLGIRK